MNRSFYVAIPVMAALTILQTAVLPHLTVFGLAPQLPFLVALSWALVRGPEEGIIWAFIGGLLVDMFSLMPIGATALAYMLGILAVIWIARALPSSRVILPMVLGLLATLIYLLVSLLIMRLLGRPVGLTTAVSLPPLALLHTVLILPIYWLLYSIDRRLQPRRVEL